MVSLYVFSLLVGGALLAVSLFGGQHGQHGQGDLDHAHDGSDNAAQFLSLRTLTYFMFVFGGVGSALSWSWGRAGFIPVLLISFAAATGVAGLVGATFSYLYRTESGARDSEDGFVGLAGRVVVPIAAGGMGKVLVHRGDRTYELLARPLDVSSTETVDWKSVIVVEMSRGTALVAPLDDRTLQEGS